jgi:mitogen-activated protein kinase 1/3
MSSNQDVYLIQELMDTDMQRVIQHQQLSDDHCQYFVYQILRGLKALHSANVLHRDLKPSNLLVNANCYLKISDLGLARSTAGVRDEQASMTEYVATRWYRAPEIMLDYRQYTKAIDVWSVGCILAEMLNSKPLLPGENDSDQINLIFELLGTPTAEDYEAIRSKRTRTYIHGLAVKPKLPLKNIFAEASDSALDLLEKLLTFNPTNRLTVKQALGYPYLEVYHNPKDEPTAEPAPEDLLAFDKNANSLSVGRLKGEIM